MPNRAEFKALALSRLKEARVLFNNGLYDGAFYLAGYSLESAFKARICKILDSDYPQGRQEYGSFLTHNYVILLKLAGLSRKLDIDKYANITLANNWSLLTTVSSGWSETLRYKPIGNSNKTSVSDILDALDDKNHGLISWLKKTW